MTIIVKSVALKNWMPFRGNHERALGPGVHAITARREADPESSNWAGKSSWAWTIPFALWGVKPKAVRLEDDWITKGEKAGGVTLILGDKKGSAAARMSVARERKRGSGTKLTVTWKQGRKKHTATGSEAQAKIDDLVGLSRDDFFASCFFEQKTMSRFIVCQPADRLAVIGAWLDLGPLQRCADNVGGRLTKLLEADAQHIARVAVLEGMKAELMARLEHGDLEHGNGETPMQVLSQLIDKATIDVESKLAASRKLQEQLDDLADWIVTAQTAADYDRLVEHGKALRGQLEAMKPAQLEQQLASLERAKSEAEQKEGAAIARLDEISKHVGGQFDGRCPVMLDRCPVAADVRTRASENDTALESARQDETTASRAAAAARAKARKVGEQLTAARSLKTRLDGMRERAKVLKQAADEIERDGQPPDTEELQRQVEAARGASDDARAQLRDAEVDLKRLQEWNVEAGAIEDSRRTLAGQVATHREALAVFGRRGAQRIRAEGSLAVIEAGANLLLREAGIDLAIEVVWSREASSGLARTCETCGEPFPQSQRIKECSTCSEVRGPKLIDKLDVELSDRSGAAEDLAGIAFQLSAAAWLRRERGSRWSTAVVDEPFGSLDACTRRALATQLAGMLEGRFGFEQAFVIAHQQDAVDMLPERVEIVAGAEGSRVC